MENSVTKLLESWPPIGAVVVVVVVVVPMVPLHARATERGGALLVHTCCEVPLPVRARFFAPRPRLSACSKRLDCSTRSLVPGACCWMRSFCRKTKKPKHFVKP
uniref:Uncharacterized protein n=1 Tax=Anopheles melas TaxID=34690 RepID=A0A182U7L6_9DIPT